MIFSCLLAAHPVGNPANSANKNRSPSGNPSKKFLFTVDFLFLTLAVFLPPFHKKISVLLNRKLPYKGQLYLCFACAIENKVSCKSLEKLILFYNNQFVSSCHKPYAPWAFMVLISRLIDHTPYAPYACHCICSAHNVPYPLCPLWHIQRNMSHSRLPPLIKAALPTALLS